MEVEVHPADSLAAFYAPTFIGDEDAVHSENWAEPAAVELGHSFRMTHVLIGTIAPRKARIITPCDFDVRFSLVDVDREKIVDRWSILMPSTYVSMAGNRRTTRLSEWKP